MAEIRESARHIINAAVKNVNTIMVFSFLFTSVRLRLKQIQLVTFLCDINKGEVWTKPKRNALGGVTRLSVSD